MSYHKIDPYYDAADLALKQREQFLIAELASIRQQIELAEVRREIKRVRPLYLWLWLDQIVTDFRKRRDVATPEKSNVK